MAKTIFFSFGSGNPSQFTGLAPTLIVFKLSNGTNVTAPAITEVSATGIYQFAWGVTTPIAFVIDAASASISNATRYIPGSLDPNMAIDEVGTTLIAIGSSLSVQGASLTAQGVSLLAQGVTILSYVVGFSSSISGIGSTASSFGNTATDPATIFGYLKRLQEFNEGNSVFSKTPGTWDIYSRGSSTELIQKVVTDAAGTVTKT